VENILTIAERGFVLFVDLEKLRNFVNQVGVTGFEVLMERSLFINN
jgi:hypothetical protein